ncbi:MAG TPA: MBL fold metallo-hydrolase, partial [Gemmatimonadales bacterium]|nr:MBL fold metallo-hydrolase [Gemmatimonadales bacterium]
MHRRVPFVILLAWLAAAAGTTPTPVRLYVLDCGTTEHLDPARFGLEHVAVPRLADPCFLVVHPKGTLLWDAGVVADSAWKPNGEPQLLHIQLPGGAPREITVRQRLADQLAAIGVAPERVTFLALSHAHWDHTGNVYQFTHATWLARRAERDAMFAQPPLALSRPADFAGLEGAKTVLLTDDE